MKEKILFLILINFTFNQYYAQSIKKNDKKKSCNIHYEVTGKPTLIEALENGCKINTHSIKYDALGRIAQETFNKESDSSSVVYVYENGEIVKKAILWHKIDQQNFSLKVINYSHEIVYDATSGVIREEGFYKERKKDSVWTYFDQNGSVKAIENYKKGKRNGACKRFYSDKKLAESVNILEENYEGLRIILSETGDTLECANYTNNKRHGYCTSIENLIIKDLCEDSKTFKLQGIYSHGKMNGHIILRYTNEQLAAELNYKDNELEGLRQLFDDNGSLIYSANYLKGKQNGKEYKFYSNGKSKQETNYLNGIAVDIQITYFESGKKSENALFENGVVKSLIHYYENGKIKSKTIYLNGSIQEKEVWNEAGKKIISKNEK